MTTPRTERAIQAIVAQLQTILVASGYHTNAGQHVYRARRSFAKAEAPAISVFFVSKTPANGTARSLQQTVELSIEGHVSADQDETGTQLVLIMADIEKCLGSWDCDNGVKDADGKLGALVFGGATAAERADGSVTEAVQVKVSVVLHEARRDPAKQSDRA